VVAREKVLDLWNVHIVTSVFEDDFISLVIKIFGCLHRQNDDFLHVLTWHDQ
jgi:hypothetical protein